MKVLVDADGCPVVDEAVKISQSFNLEVILVCDTAHEMQREGARTIITTKGADSADFVLINEVKAGDVVITQDYGLATMALAKKAYGINQNGLIYSDENIEGLLFSRHVGKEVRRKGGRTKGPKKRSKEQDERFIEAFTALLTRRLKES